MLASLLDAPLIDPDLIYEPKYDGIRAIAEIMPAGPVVRLWSRLGNEKTSQFPEIVAALTTWARRSTQPVVLDGEIVALDGKGDPAGFQQLQGRIHLTGPESGVAPAPARGRKVEKSPRGHQPSAIQPEVPGPERVAFIAFDVLREGSVDLRNRPLVERRRELERIFGRTGSAILRISEMVRGDGRLLYQRALENGWEGLIAKHAASVYKSGKRTPDWRKLKILHEQEFVVAGWTEPRHTRSYFGALLLGVYEPSRGGTAGNELVYVGHTGTGFNEKELARVMALLKPLETRECPFASRPRTNEKPHWVQPSLVAQIKFTEWTADGKLRHPVYVGLRDDKQPQEVRREPTSPLHEISNVRLTAQAPAVGRSAASAKSSPPALAATNRRQASARSRPSSRSPRTKADGDRPEQGDGGSFGESRKTGVPPAANTIRDLVDQLQAIERSRRDGVLLLPEGGRLAVSNLHKLFWPKQQLTKGDLFRYYAQVAPVILPAVADRPLVMKRFPNGITGKPFYQHRAEQVPEGIRVESVPVATPGARTARGGERRPYLIGGSLRTLLYMTQLAAISQDPWFSRIQSLESADYAALDLDPMPGVPFARVLDVARWIRDELESLGAVGVAKTSGADGLHVYIPLPPDTPYDAGLLFCRIVATVVSRKHPRVATIERSVRARGPKVYIDYLQNIPGKTLATAYSARASEYAGASTPLTWDEIDRGVDREAFTIETVPARLQEVGDLWATLREADGVDLSRVARYREQKD